MEYVFYYFQRFAVKIIDTVLDFVFVEEHKEAADTILVFYNAGLGDFILSIPAMLLLRDMYHDKRLVFLTVNPMHGSKIQSYTTAEDRCPWLKLLPNGIFDRVIYVDSSSVINLFRWARAFRHSGFMLNTSKMYILGGYGNFDFPCFLSAVKKICFVRYMGLSGEVITSYHITNKPCVAYYPQVLSILSTVLGDKEFDAVHVLTVPWRFHESLDLRNTEKSKADGNCLSIIFSPGFMVAHKSWDTSNWVVLAYLLIRKYDANIILTGTKSCGEIGTYIESHVCDLGRIKNLIGKTTIMELAMLCLDSDFVIGIGDCKSPG